MCLCVFAAYRQRLLQCSAEGLVKSLDTVWFVSYPKLNEFHVPIPIPVQLWRRNNMEQNKRKNLTFQLPPHHNNFSWNNCRVLFSPAWQQEITENKMFLCGYSCASAKPEQCCDKNFINICTAIIISRLFPYLIVAALWWFVCMIISMYSHMWWFYSTVYN